MEFKHYLSEQIRRHPSMQPQDVVKLCYQSAYGAEHLLKDTVAAKNYLETEFADVSALDTDLYEAISDRVCRINLAAWKYKKLPLPWLFHMFASSPPISNHGIAVLKDHLRAAEAVITCSPVRFDLSDWNSYLHAYMSAGMPAVHHSEQYRQNEHPHYRVVNRQLLRLLPILERISHAGCDREPYVIAIDGRAASGKTTLANQLEQLLDADVIRMDDFFLPPELRTQDRFLTPGGNIHYERFSREVIPYIAHPAPFSYRIFDCGKMDYRGEKEIAGKRFRIVEGSYSCHPAFGRYADLTVFLHIEPQEQMRRIQDRNGAQMAEVFHSKWIPLEEAYFSHYAISEKADLLL